MIDVFNPYPAYKDSGVRWLGEVPEHWTVLRQRNAVDLRVSNVDKHSKDGELAVRLCNYVDVYKNERIAERISFMRASATRGEIERFRLQTGDILITKDSETWNDIGVPALVECSAPDLICGYHLALLRPRAGLVDGPFLLRVQQSLPVAYQYHIAASGVTRYGLSHDAIKSVFLPCPPLPEQATIVRFLDHADRRIRRYIHAKQTLIKLLEEQKQAIIHRAVTRGLDPHVRLKPSGVEWLGDVPEHWQILPLARLLQERKEKNDPIKTTNLLSLSLGAGVIPYADKKPGGNKAKEDLSAYMLAYPGDIVVNSMNVVVGSVGLSRYFGAVSPVYYMLRPWRSEDAVEYFDAVFHDVVFQRSLFGLGNGILYIESKTTGKLNTIRLRIPMSKLKRVVLPYPCPREQSAIVEQLATATASIERSIDGTRSAILLLRKYRTRLIADVVTGKLDVREAAATLPDETEESESLDDIVAIDTDEAAEDADIDAPEEEDEA